MNNIIFINKNLQNKEHSLNTLISFKDLSEYQNKPISDIISLMNSRKNEKLEESIIDKNLIKSLENNNTKKILEETIAKAIEDSLRK